MKISRNAKLKFTGERLIPEINKGTTFFYEHLARYLFVLQISKNKVILDAGCGCGYGSYIIAKYGHPKKVYAVDISKQAIEYAKNKYRSNDVFYKINNLEKLTLIKNNSIDIVMSFEVIEHLNNQEIFLNQVLRVLKSKGIFFSSTPNIFTHPKGNPFHKKEFNPRGFYKFLKRYLKI